MIETNDERDIRRLGGLVLAKKSEPAFACNLKATDLQTPATYELLNSCQGQFFVPNHVYLIKADHLQKMLSGPSAFHPEVDVKVRSFLGLVCTLAFSPFAELFILQPDSHTPLVHAC